MSFVQETFNLEKLDLEKKSHNYLSAKNKIKEGIKKKEYGFIKDLYEKNFEEILVLAKKLRKFHYVLFLGTGGSSLGGKTLVSLKGDQFNNFEKPKIFFLENVDIEPINSLIDKIQLDKTAVVVTSKSGETIETIAQFFFLESRFKRKRVSLKKRVFVITEDKQSSLKKIQEEKELDFLNHPMEIGGRYSVFSIVGLLPAAVVNFKIKSFCGGAKNFLRTIEQKEKKFDDLFLPAFSLNRLSKKGINMSVMMPYVDSLNNLSFWFRQLWAESIGKKRMGITPINALGTIDQHSQLQLYLDGPRDKFFTIIGKVFKKSKGEKLDCYFSPNEKYELLHNASFEKLLHAEMSSTIQTLKKFKLPMRVIMLNSLDEELIGSLMMFFIIETIFSCYLNNVNPFDQPAVEAGKELTKEILKR
ncbi:MAG: glucose-6-phosphate isomerase [Pseudomonadota bacterium]|nr:glucose-6-phosphate isomerase [Pseudomonadota bacterium]